MRNARSCGEQFLFHFFQRCLICLWEKVYVPGKRGFDFFYVVFQVISAQKVDEG